MVWGDGKKHKRSAKVRRGEKKKKAKRRCVMK